MMPCSTLLRSDIGWCFRWRRLMLTIAIASQVFSQAFVESAIIDQVSHGLGPEVAFVLSGP
jgi:hypothetical protein